MSVRLREMEREREKERSWWINVCSGTWMIDRKINRYDSAFSPPLWRCGPTRAKASSFLRFLDHTQRRTTVGRTPVDQWSARRRDLYLTTHNTYNKHPCPGGIRTHSITRRMAPDLRPSGHWEWHDSALFHFSSNWPCRKLACLISILKVGQRACVKNAKRWLGVENLEGRICEVHAWRGPTNLAKSHNCICQEVDMKHVSYTG